MIKTKVKHLGTRFVAILMALLILDGSTPWLGLSLRAEAATTKTPEQIAADAAKYGGYDIQDFGHFKGAQAMFIRAPLSKILSVQSRTEFEAYGKDGIEHGAVLDIQCVTVDPIPGYNNALKIETKGTLHSASGDTTPSYNGGFVILLRDGRVNSSEHAIGADKVKNIEVRQIGNLTAIITPDICPTCSVVEGSFGDVFTGIHAATETQNLGKPHTLTQAELESLHTGDITTGQYRYTMSPSNIETVGGSGYVRITNTGYPDAYADVPIKFAKKNTVTIVRTTGATSDKGTYEAYMGEMLDPAPSVTVTPGYRLEGWKITNTAAGTTLIDKTAIDFGTWEYPYEIDTTLTPITVGLADIHAAAVTAPDGAELPHKDLTTNHNIEESYSLAALNTEYARAGYKLSWTIQKHGSDTTVGSTYTTQIPANTLSAGKTYDLVPKWTPYNYTVNYEGGTGTTGSKDADTFTYGANGNGTTNVIHDGSAFKKTGYLFDQWLGSSLDGKTTVKIPGGANPDEYLLPTVDGQSTTLTAQWRTIIYYGAKLDANGGALPTELGVWTKSGNYATYKTKAGNPDDLDEDNYCIFPATAPVPTKAGIAFLGWYTEANGGTQVYDATGAVTSNAAARRITHEGQTLYAHWAQVVKKDLTVTVDETPTFNGHPLTPQVTVQYEGTTLTQGTDYLLVWNNNINATLTEDDITSKGTGKASVTVYPINDYLATANKKTVEFDIKMAPNTLTIKGSDVPYGESMTVTYTTTFDTGATATLTAPTDKAGKWSVSGMTVTSEKGAYNLAETTGSEFTLTVPGNDNVKEATETLTIKAVKAKRSASFQETHIISEMNPTTQPTNTLTLTPEDETYSGYKAKITYTSSKTDVATVNSETGAVTVKPNVAGGTDITVTIAATDHYEEASATYALTVASNVATGKVKVTNTVYDGMSHDALTVSDLKPADARVYYQIAETQPASGDANWSEPVPQVLNANSVAKGTGTDAAGKTVWYKISGGQGYEPTIGFVIPQVIPAPLKEDSLTVKEKSTYDGTAKTPDVEFEAMLGGDQSTKYTVQAGDNNENFTVTYANNTNAGSNATVMVQGKGNYSGFLSKNFTIDTRPITNVTIADIPEQNYTGALIMPTLTVTDTINNQTVTLVEGQDYAVVSRKSDSADSISVGSGKGYVEIEGRGNYQFTGAGEAPTLNKNFDIVTEQAVLNLMVDNTYRVFNGQEQKSTWVVSGSLNGISQTLTYGVDYTIEGAPALTGDSAAATGSTDAKTYAGTYTVKVTGIGKFAGAASEETWTISPAQLVKGVFKGTVPTYTGSRIEQPLSDFTVTAQTANGTLDIEAKYLTAIYGATGSDCTAAGGTSGYVTIKPRTDLTGDDAKFANSLTGEVGVYYAIAARSVNDLDAAQFGAVTKTYTGKSIMPSDMKFSYNGKDLTINTDYTLSYSNNVNADQYKQAQTPVEETGKITVTGKGNFTGERDITLDILPKNIDGTDTEGAGAVSAPTDNAKNSPYTGGNPVRPNTNGWLSYNGFNLTSDDYDVAFSNNTSVGKGAIAKFTGKGNYTGERTVLFEITSTDNLVVSVQDATYTGYPVTPEVTVTMNGQTVDPSNYALYWENNVNASLDANGQQKSGLGNDKLPTVRVFGTKGAYYGQTGSKTFSIAMAERDASFAENAELTSSTTGYQNSTLTYAGADENPTISYVTSDSSVASAAADGTLSTLKPGKATITAKIGETTNYKATTASYTVNVLVTVTLKDETNGSSKTVSGTVDSIIPYDAMTREGYDFAGWSESSEKNAAGDTQPLFRADFDGKTLYAVWVKRASGAQYIVTFDPNGGTLNGLRRLTTDENGLLFGQTVPTATPKDSEMEFKGWRMGENTIFTNASDAPVFTADTTVTAVYAKKPVLESYTIHFHGNGGNPDLQTVMTSPATNKAETWPAAERAGYTFDGWFTKPTGGYSYSKDAEFTADMDLYAHWTAENGEATAPFVVNFDANGGKVDKESIKTDDAGHLTEQPNITEKKAGYNFTGWFTTRDGGVMVDLDKWIFTSDTTLYAHWAIDAESKIFTITFDPNGGTVSPTSMSTKQDGTLSGTLPIPVYEGYAFDGWYTSRIGGAKIEQNTVYGGKSTVYAHWTRESTDGFKITFNANGGTFAEGAETVLTTDTNGTLTDKTFPDVTREGYSLRGWQTGANKGATVTNESVFTSDTTVYAVWLKDGETPTGGEHTITLDFQTPGVEDAKQNTTNGKLANLPTPTRDGASFLGWFMESEGGMKVTTDTIFIADDTIYAQWKLKQPGDAGFEATITFDPNGGTLTGAASMTTGTNGKLAQLLTDPTRDGYTFDGWYTNRLGGIISGAKVTTDTVFYESQTVYAKWIKNTDAKTYTITFNPNGGTYTGPETKETGTNGKLTGLPTPNPTYPDPSFTFRGWAFSTYEKQNFVTTDTVFDSDLMVYAIYLNADGKRPDEVGGEYTITFDPMGGALEEGAANTAVTKNGKIEKLPAATREGYLFDAWYTENNNGTLSGERVTTDTIFMADDTVYARWYQTASVVFDANGGKFADGTGTKTLTTNGRYQLSTLPEVTTPPAGKYFDHWAMKSDLSEVTLATDFSAYVNQTVQVIAIYKDEAGKYSITFDANGGTITSGDLILKTDENGTLAGKTLPTAERSGHTFDGWFYNGQKVTSSTVFKANTIVYASWTGRGGSGGGGGSSSGSGSGVKNACKRDKTCPIWPFTDASTTAWYHDGVHYCLENGMMLGKNSTIFAPNGTVTRGQIVAILWRLDGKPMAGTDSYSDVPAGQYYAQAVAWASANGVVTGYSDGTFRPDMPITREQMAAILWRYAKYKSVNVSGQADLSRFTDRGQVASYAAQAMAWANANGLINGMTATTLVPRGDATRAQAASILQRFCENILKR